MNFLSHYYLLPEKENIDLIIGNLLPDLMRGFTKIYNLEIKSNPLTHGTKFIQGLHYHLLTDKLFHNSAFFQKNCNALKRITEFHKLPLKRNFIVSHIMLELIIDQYLIEQSPSLATNFYKMLDAADLIKLEDQLKMTMPRQNSSNIICIFNGFRENRYAYKLLEQEGIQAGLYHIVGKRIGLSFLEQQWRQAIQEGKETIVEGLPFFLKKIKHELNDA